MIPVSLDRELSVGTYMLDSLVQVLVFAPHEPRSSDVPDWKNAEAVVVYDWLTAARIFEECETGFVAWLDCDVISGVQTVAVRQGKDSRPVVSGIYRNVPSICRVQVAAAIAKHRAAQLELIELASRQEPVGV